MGPDLLNGIVEVDYNKRLSLGGIFTNNNSLGGFFKIKTNKGLHLGYGYEFPVKVMTFQLTAQLMSS